VLKVVHHAPLVRVRKNKPAVLVVQLAVLEHMVMGVKIALKVNTVTAVTQLRSRVEIAQPVTTVTMSVKVLVCPAFL
jgi:hypothetical protein